MRDSRKPAVGHNLSLDLAFSLNAFARFLPQSWPEYKHLVAEWCARSPDIRALGPQGISPSFMTVG